MKKLYAVFFCCLLSAAPSGAASIASSLADYEAYIFMNKIAGISDTNISGAVFKADTRTLYVVDDKSCAIYELDQGGNLLRTIFTSGFSNFEGISRYKGNHYFLTEEAPTHSDIAFATIPATGSGPVYRKDGWVDTLAADWGNDGAEGVSWRASDNMLFVAKEKKPSQLLRITLDTAGRPKSVFKDQPFTIINMSDDVSDIFALSDGNFLLVNGTELKLTGYAPDGRVLSSLDLTGMKKPEGLAVDEADGTIYVVGESRQFFVFKKKTAVFPRPDGPLPFIASMSGATRSQPAVCRFSVAYSMPVSIDLFSMDGKRTMVYERVAESGEHSAVIQEPFGNTGLRLCRFKAGTFQQIEKIFVSSRR